MAPANLIRVLYVEDNTDMHDLVKFVLGPKYDVIPVDSYASALSIAKARQFDLYLIDNTLPDGLGVDLCREFKTLNPDSHIIFCSGYDDDPHRLAAENAGAEGFLAKPFDPPELLAAVERIMPTETKE